ncbi:MAG TPA: serine/threonine-protein kinase [Nannocystaceae bacterium]|nr:serine/threonine-protein kinase [Nannocystaceae bacterium]
MPAASSDDARGESPADSLAGQSLTSGENSLSFGKYRLTRLLARGGMGEVYLARLVGELGFEKRLVIKTILPHLAAKPRFVEMFAAEAKTAVALSHGNIVPIYELGRTGDIFYIVMGHVDGPSVATLLDAYRDQERAPEIGLALHIVRGVLTGLAYAHTPEPGRAAVVHRDITPRNVLVDRSGQVRIVDFGIAAPADAQVDMRGGSTGFVAPEQLRGDAVDPRADVFSTACLLYELVTLERAFPKDGVWMTPDMRDVPEDLRAPLSEALSIDPKDRPSDAHAFLDRLGPAMARHAAMFGDPQLAAHLRALFPDGWESHSQPAVAGAAGKQRDRKRPATHTFATRLTLLTKPELSSAAASAEASAAAAAQASARPRWPLAMFGVLAIAAIAWWSMRERGGTTDAAAVVAKEESPPRAPAPAQARDPLPATPAKPEPTPPIAPPPEPTPAIDPAPAKPEPVPVADPQSTGTPRPAKKGNGYLRVITRGVEWAEVRIDGKAAKHTPLPKIPLSEGRHKIVVKCTDACSTPRTMFDGYVVIAPGDTRTVEAK